MVSVSQLCSSKADMYNIVKNLTGLHKVNDLDDLELTK